MSLYVSDGGGGRCWYTGGQGGNLVEFHNKSQTAHSLHLTRRKENFGTGNEKYVGIMCSLRRLWLRCIRQRVNKSREKKVSFSQRRVKSWKLSGQRGKLQKINEYNSSRWGRHFQWMTQNFNFAWVNKQRLIRKLKYNDWPEINNLLLLLSFYLLN